MKDIIGIGRALMDGYVYDEVHLPFFESILGGLTKGCKHYKLSHEQAKKILYKFSPLNFHQGGAVANTLACCSRLGCSTTFVGDVGKDELGDIFISSIILAGVNPIVSFHDDLSTGFTFLLNYPERDIRIGLFYYGSTDAFENENKVLQEVKDHKVLYSSAYEFIDPLKIHMKNIFIHPSVKRPELLKVLNLGGYSKETLRNKLSELDEILSKKTFDIISGNEEEYLKLFEVKKIDEETLKRVRNITSIGIITRGVNGSIIVESESEHYIPSYRKLSLSTTIGLGDAYLAGFLDKILKNSDATEAGYEGAYQAYLKAEENNNKNNLILEQNHNPLDKYK